jgi:hypothetical protein
VLKDKSFMEKRAPSKSPLRRRKPPTIDVGLAGDDAQRHQGDKEVQVDIWESSRLLETMRAVAHCWRIHRSLLLPATAGTEPDSSIILYRTQIVIPAQNIRSGQLLVLANRFR